MLHIVTSLLAPVVRDVHSLVIRSVRHAHGGVYKSVISNKVGKATCYAHLYVTGDFHYLFIFFTKGSSAERNHASSVIKD